MGLTRRATLALAGGLAGCTAFRQHAPSGIKPVSAWDAEITVSTDVYTKATTIAGPLHWRDKTGARLLAIIKGDILLYSVQAQVEARDWLFLETAYDHTGTARKLDRSDSDVHSCTSMLGCDITEYVSLQLSEDYVTAKHATGLDFKLFGRRGTAYVFIPGEYVTAVVQRTAARR